MTAARDNWLQFAAQPNFDGAASSDRGLAGRYSRTRRCRRLPCRRLAQNWCWMHAGTRAVQPRQVRPRLSARPDNAPGPLTPRTWPAGADDASAPGRTYEELCRAHIERMLAAAAAAQTQSQLSQRVGTWRSRIGPVLEEESQRAEFDIHDYGQQVLSTMAALSLDGGTDARKPGERGRSGMQGAPVAAGWAGLPLRLA